MTQSITAANADALTIGATIAPHVAEALALLLAEHYRDQPPQATLKLYAMMLAEYDAELLRIAVIECINQVKWFPKLSEIEEIIHMIRQLANGYAFNYTYQRKSFEAKATINARGDLVEFSKRLKAQTRDYIKRESEKAEARRFDEQRGRYADVDSAEINERISSARARREKAIENGEPERAQYWTDYIAHCEAQLLDGDA